MHLYPLKFQPLYKYRIWGGNKLKSVLNKGYNEENIGESWEISDVAGDETMVLNGDLKGLTLKKLIQEFKGDSEVLKKHSSEVKFKLSFEKICRMYKNAHDNGFASYAEA